MKLAIVAADFTAVRGQPAAPRHGDLPQCRHASIISRTRWSSGMVARGYEREFAERCFKQIEGFGSYGFPESHALSFARLVYVSSWIKCHHPAVFTCALLNSQPMGFYAPAQLVRDASEHGVEVLPVDINFSDWDNTPGARAARSRFGWACARSMASSEDWAEEIAQAREPGALRLDRGFGPARELPSRALRLLADADAFGSLGRTGATPCGRCGARRRISCRCSPPPRRGSWARSRTRGCPRCRSREHVTADYQTTRLSLKGHPMQFLRAHFRRRGRAELRRARAGQGRPPRPRRRASCCPPAAGQGQCDLHHAGGRDRHHQRAALGAASSRSSAAR